MGFFTKSNMREISELINKYSNQIEQSVRDRLYKSGTYSDGTKIKTYKAQGSSVYSEFTEKTKTILGEPYDRVTLKDTGELYESFAVKNEGSGFAIEFDEDKENGKVSDNIPELEEAIAIDEEGLSEIIELIKDDLRDDFKQEITEALLY